MTTALTPPPYLLSAADERAHDLASHVRVVHDVPPEPELVELLDRTIGVIARWEAEEIAADIALYLAHGGAEDNPSIPPIPPPPPKSADVIQLHSATRRFQAAA
ncbi:hypothetical protein ABZ312_11525 [Streptomyces sp. NPDC006207]